VAQIDLLRSLPKTKRNIGKRQSAKTTDAISKAKQYGEQYFDGPREYGYGGYIYDGRWLPVARDFIQHFNLKSGDKVLDIGCAKGFLVQDFMLANNDIQAFGLDISEYAIKKADASLAGRLHLGSADNLPFPDNSFDAVISLNTIHNLPRDRAIVALAEIERVSRGKSFIQVDSYHTKEQKEIFESWVLTAEFHDYPDGWLELFTAAGYTGDYYWTVIE